MQPLQQDIPYTPKRRQEADDCEPDPFEKRLSRDEFTPGAVGYIEGRVHFADSQNIYIHAAFENCIFRIRSTACTCGKQAYLEVSRQSKGTHFMIFISFVLLSMIWFRAFNPKDGTVAAEKTTQAISTSW
jgi:hypothetical protein